MLARLRRAWSYARRFEPARLRAAWTALGILLTAVGLTIPYDLDGRVMGLITAFGIALTYGQAESTRAAVVPLARYQADVAEALAADPPGRHAAGHVFDGTELIQPR